MDEYAALERATATFAATLAAVEDAQWSVPSIDPGWSVRDLVNHVVGGNRRYVLLLAGAPTSDVELLRDVDHLGDDPGAAFATTSAQVTAAFRGPGVLARTVHHRLGDRTGAELLVLRVMEHALHGWDLARSIGARSELDADVVGVILAADAADPTLLARAGYPPYQAPLADDPVTRLLQLTGRAS